VSKNVVFMISVVHDQRSEDQGYEWSIKSWKKWCDKNDCELFILEETLLPIKDMKLTWQRYYLFDILESNGIDYNQILMVDSDTIVHPNSPNFFELSENKYCGVVNPLSDWILRSIEVYSKAIFKEDKMIPYYNYINGGFQIVNKEHKDFFKTMTDFYHSNKLELLNIQNNYHLGSDQTPLNFLLDINKISCKLLSYKFNMQELVRIEALSDDMIHTKMGWVYHFNAWPKPNPRYWMEKTYRSLYEK
tara:strand:+ start:3718 stop:4458 length:741 start_codon:yes stop_codon:yes gene_type:complete